MPSTRVSVMELCSQDDEDLVLTKKEKIEWLAGGLLENLFYKLYDEAGREVPLTVEIASMIKVSLYSVTHCLCCKCAAINKISLYLTNPCLLLDFYCSLSLCLRLTGQEILI